MSVYEITNYIRTGMWSRSRRLGLESRDVLTSRLGLVSDKILNVSASSRSRSNMSRSRLSRSRLGSRAIASRQDVLCRRSPCIL